MLRRWTALSVKKLFFFCHGMGKGVVFAVLFAPVPEKEILDSIEHGSIIIRVFTVFYMAPWLSYFPATGDLAE